MLETHLKNDADIGTAVDPCPSQTPKYWKIEPLLKRAKLFNFVVGARSIGKTYAAKKWAIDDFLQSGSKFVYVRRFKKERQKLKTFFNDISEKYPEHKFSCDTKYFYIDKEIAGYALDLSTAKSEKSVVYKGVSKIIFDEFILDKGLQHYIPDEVVNFLELYVTISRGDDITVLFLANSITDYNPYFVYFDTYPNGTGFTTNGEIVIENVDPQKYKTNISESRFAKLIQNTPYGNYVIDNKSLRDKSNFIKKKSGTSKHSFNFIYNNTTFGVWVDNSFTFVSFDIQNNYTIALSEENISADSELNASARSPFKTLVVKKYRQGLCYFESAKIKGLCIEAIKKFL